MKIIAWIHNHIAHAFIPRLSCFSIIHRQLFEIKVGSALHASVPLLVFNSQITLKGVNQVLLGTDVS